MRRWSCFLATAVLAMVLVMLVTIAGCAAPPVSKTSSDTTPTTSSGVADGSPASPPGTLRLSVDSLLPGAVLPDAYTCKGTGTSPEVTWDGIPAGTKSLVLVLDDPDAPRGTFTHWVIYNIPPVAGSLGSAQPAQKVLANGAQQAENTAGSRGYYPPCPPIGATHRYIFRLYALDTEIAQPTADRGSVDSAMYGHIVGNAEFSTTFAR